MKMTLRTLPELIAHSFKWRGIAELPRKLNVRAVHLRAMHSGVCRYALHSDRTQNQMFRKGFSESRRCFASNPEVIEVQHDPYMKIFYIEIDDVERAYIKYDIIDKTMIIFSTQVPDELRGRRVGQKIAKEALQFARSKNLMLDIHCDFVQHYIDKYAPEYLKYIEQ